MDRAPRFFSRDLTPTQSRVYRLATAWFVVAALLMSWPLYAWLARIRPFVLGMPFSLFWLAAVLVTSFLVALALYGWESRSGLLDEAEDAPTSGAPRQG